MSICALPPQQRKWRKLNTQQCAHPCSECHRPLLKKRAHVNVPQLLSNNEREYLRPIKEKSVIHENLSDLASSCQTLSNNNAIFTSPLSDPTFQRIFFLHLLPEHVSPFLTAEDLKSLSGTCSLAKRVVGGTLAANQDSASCTTNEEFFSELVPEQRKQRVEPVGLDQTLPSAIRNDKGRAKNFGRPFRPSASAHFRPGIPEEEEAGDEADWFTRRQHGLLWQNLVHHYFPDIALDRIEGWLRVSVEDKLERKKGRDARQSFQLRRSFKMDMLNSHPSHDGPMGEDRAEKWKKETYADDTSAEDEGEESENPPLSMLACQNTHPGFFSSGSALTSREPSPQPPPPPLTHLPFSALRLLQNTHSSHPSLAHGSVVRPPPLGENNAMADLIESSHTVHLFSSSPSCASSLSRRCQGMLRHLSAANPRMDVPLTPEARGRRLSQREVVIIADEATTTASTDEWISIHRRPESGWTSLSAGYTMENPSERALHIFPWRSFFYWLFERRIGRTIRAITQTMEEAKRLFHWSLKSDLDHVRNVTSVPEPPQIGAEKLPRIIWKQNCYAPDQRARNPSNEPVYYYRQNHLVPPSYPPDGEGVQVNLPAVSVSSHCSTTTTTAMAFEKEQAAYRQSTLVTLPPPQQPQLRLQQDAKRKRIVAALRLLTSALHSLLQKDEEEEEEEVSVPVSVASLSLDNIAWRRAAPGCAERQQPASFILRSAEGYEVFSALLHARSAIYVAQEEWALALQDLSILEALAPFSSAKVRDFHLLSQQSHVMRLGRTDHRTSAFYSVSHSVQEILQHQLWSTAEKSSLNLPTSCPSPLLGVDVTSRGNTPFLDATVPRVGPTWYCTRDMTSSLARRFFETWTLDLDAAALSQVPLARLGVLRQGLFFCDQNPEMSVQQLSHSDTTAVPLVFHALRQSVLEEELGKQNGWDIAPVLSWLRGGNREGSGDGVNETLLWNSFQDRFDWCPTLAEVCVGTLAPLNIEKGGRWSFTTTLYHSKNAPVRTIMCSNKLLQEIQSLAVEADTWSQQKIFPPSAETGGVHVRHIEQTESYSVSATRVTESILTRLYELREESRRELSFFTTDDSGNVLGTDKWKVVLLFRTAALRGVPRMLSRIAALKKQRQELQTTNNRDSDLPLGSQGDVASLLLYHRLHAELQSDKALLVTLLLGWIVVSPFLWDQLTALTFLSQLSCTSPVGIFSSSALPSADAVAQRRACRVWRSVWRGQQNSQECNGSSGTAAATLVNYAASLALDGEEEESVECTMRDHSGYQQARPLLYAVLHVLPSHVLATLEISRWHVQAERPEVGCYYLTRALMHLLYGPSLCTKLNARKGKASHGADVKALMPLMTSSQSFFPFAFPRLPECLRVFLKSHRCSSPPPPEGDDRNKVCFSSAPLDHPLLDQLVETEWSEADTEEDDQFSLYLKALFAAQTGEGVQHSTDSDSPERLNDSRRYQQEQCHLIRHLSRGGYSVPRLIPSRLLLLRSQCILLYQLFHRADQEEEEESQDEDEEHEAQVEDIVLEAELQSPPQEEFYESDPPQPEGQSDSNAREVGETRTMRTLSRGRSASAGAAVLWPAPSASSPQRWAPRRPLDLSLAAALHPRSSGCARLRAAVLMDSSCSTEALDILEDVLLTSLQRKDAELMLRFSMDLLRKQKQVEEEETSRAPQHVRLPQSFPSSGSSSSPLVSELQSRISWWGGAVILLGGVPAPTPIPVHGASSSGNHRHASTDSTSFLPISISQIACTLDHFNHFVAHTANSYMETV